MAIERKSSVNYRRKGEEGRYPNYAALADLQSKHESNVLKVPANLTVAEIAWWAHLRSATEYTSNIHVYTCKPIYDLYVVVKVRHTWCNAAQIVGRIPNY